MAEDRSALWFDDEDLDLLLALSDKEDPKAYFQAFDSVMYKLAHGSVANGLRRDAAAYLFVKNAIRILKDPDEREFTMIERTDRVMQILLRIRAAFEDEVSRPPGSTELSV